jgi:hypothetical protein
LPAITQLFVFANSSGKTGLSNPCRELAQSAAPGLFAVIDRIGEGPNLEEYHYPRPFTARMA